MVLIPLYRGSGYLDIGGRRFHLRIADGSVEVSGGLLAESVAIDDLVDVVLQLGVAADELLAQMPRDERLTSSCPRCGAVTRGAYIAQVCSVCGHGWRTAPDDDGDDRPGGTGGGA